MEGDFHRNICYIKKELQKSTTSAFNDLISHADY